MDNNKMENKNSSGVGGGIGFCGMLAIVFIALKLAKVISWSWIWVLSPLWIPVTIVLTAIIILAVVRLTIAIFRR